MGGRNDSQRRGAIGTLAAIALARIAFGYQVQTVATLGPDLVAAFDLSLAALGTLMGAFMLPGIAAALPFGFLARRYGDRAIAGTGLVLMALGGGIAGLGFGPLGIGIGRVVAGTGAVAITVLQGKIVGDLWRGTRFDLAIGLLIGAFPIGIGLAQILQPPIAAAFGWPAAFLSGGALSAVAAVLFLLTWRGPPHVAGGRTLAWPTRQETVLVIVCGLVWTTYNAGYFNFLAYMPTALAERGHPAGLADVVMSIATWGNLPAILLGGAIAARLGPTRVFNISTVVGIVAVAGMGVVDWPLLWGTLFGTLASLHAGLIVAVGTLSARPENRAVAMGVFYTIYYLGTGATPAICGAAADLAGDASGAFLAAGALSALALPLWYAHRALARRGYAPT
jgi:MFS family permease